MTTLKLTICLLSASTAALTFACSSPASSPTPHSISESAEDPYSSQYLSVPNPDVPEIVDLCGSEINLTRTDMWERYDRELTALLYGHGNTLLTIKRANKYFPVMAPILKKNGVPEDFLYLACIESYLNHRAQSSAKAAGIWQFMPSTAKEYGLEVNDEVDERFNLEKATEAASRFLKNAYRKYGDWESVMASYNGGMGRISREREAQQADTSFDLWLTDETSRYVFRVMAMKEIMENPSAYGFQIKAEQLYQPEEFTEVEVNTSVADWPAWAKKHGITYAQLREANPWIRAKTLTNKLKKTYFVKIPTEKSLRRPTASDAVVYNYNWVK